MMPGFKGSCDMFSSWFISRIVEDSHHAYLRGSMFPRGGGGIAKGIKVPP